ncbi:Xyloglucan galactosyltransferase KATAMARI1 [Platanthera zijinensis]|uniref:Xyloglucan galactosyltransferase KATAMARI1 n=1 Tax=Platanthera zijinensis TaxID=2320716 RepID=A0AAP0FV24_9ASPA
MTVTLLRRRSPDLRHHPNKTSAILSIPTVKSSLLSISTSFLLLILLTIWCFYALLSNSFHLCFSSRKLDVFCISGGTGADSSENRTIASSKQGTSSSINRRQKEVADGINSVEEYIHTIRSWATANTTSAAPSCDGRGVFVYDLPAKFNKDLVAKCGELLPWSDLCEYFSNDGLGVAISGLGPGWHRTHQYSLEPIFHSRVLRHRCRVTDPAKAALFYVPFYAGLDVLHWHFINASVSDKDSLSAELVQWLEARPEWSLHGGRNHMFVLGKISWDFRRTGDGQWGSRFLSLPQMQAPYKFLIERQPWEVNEIGVPHPTHFHPHSDDQIEAWQSTVAGAKRGTMVSFVGAARPEAAESIRSKIIRQCAAAGGTGECRFVDCGGGGCGEPKEVVETFMRSEFCLQPPGDSPTRKSVFDGLVAGCIPVLFDPFTAYYQYPWHLPEDRRRYSVYLDQEEVREGRVDVVEKLRAVSAKEKEEMRRCIIYELLPGLVYGDAGSEFRRFRDAFGIVMDNMIEMVSRNEKG